MNTPEDESRTGLRSAEDDNGDESVVNKVKRNAQLLIQKIKSVFTAPEEKIKVEHFLSEDRRPEPPGQPVSLIDKPQKKQEFTVLRVALSQNTGKQAVIDAVINVAQTIATDSKQANSSADNEFLDDLQKSSKKIDESTALPFGRYILALEAKGLLLDTSDISQVLNKALCLKDIFIDGTDFSGQSLDAAGELLLSMFTNYRYLFKNESELRYFSKLVKEFESRGATNLSRLRTELNKFHKEGHLKRDDEAEKRKLWRKGDEQAGILIDHYEEFEREIDSIESISSEETKRLQKYLRYHLLELDFDEILKLRREKEARYEKERRERGQGEDLDKPDLWAEVKKEVYDKCFEEQWFKNLAPEQQTLLKEKAQIYFSSFTRVLDEKMNHLLRFDPYAGGNEEDSDFNASARLYRQTYNLTQSGFSAYSSTLLGFAFLESGQKELKDLFLRFKTKSFLEHAHEGKNKKKELLEGKDGKELMLDLREVDEFILKDVKRIYMKEAALRVTGKDASLSQELSIMKNRLENIINNKVEISQGKINFLGNSASKSVGLRVLSSRGIENRVDPTLGTYVQSREKFANPDHQNLADLLIDMKGKASQLNQHVQQCQQILQSIASGDTEALQKAANILDNYTFGDLSGESHVVLTSMAAYVDSFRHLIQMGDGQFRPSLFSKAEGSGMNFQELYMYRAQALHGPGMGGDEGAVEQDEAIVYGAVGKALAWGVGDIAQQLARTLPPMDFMVSGIQDHFGSIATLMEKTKSKYADKEPEEIERQKIEALTDYLGKNVMPELKPVFSDEFARPFLTKVNPIFNFLLWADELREFKYYELLLGAAYSTLDDDEATNAARNKLGILDRTGRQFKRAFGKSDTISSPQEVLFNTPKETRALYFGMDSDILKQRIEGKIPFAIRLPNLAFHVGLGEKNGWRENAFNHSGLINKYLTFIAERKKTKPQEKENLYELLDFALQVGPRTALVLLKKLDPAAGDPQMKHKLVSLLGPNEAQQKKEYAKATKYIYEKTYELFPSLFIVRNDLRRHIRKTDKTFMDYWNEDIQVQISAATDEGKELLELMPQSGAFQTYNTETNELARERVEAQSNAGRIQGLLLESLMTLEKYVMNERNKLKLTMDPDNPMITLREVLQDVLTKKDQSRHIKVLETMYSKFHSDYSLDITGDEDKNKSRFAQIVARNLYKVVYSSSSEGMDAKKFEASEKGTTSKKGFTDKMRYINWATGNEKDRSSEVDYFTFLRSLERKYSGPVFDFYYENLALNDPDIFNPQNTGDPNSGKSLTIRAFGDLQTFTKGIDGIMAAVKEVHGGIRATNEKELGSAEDAFLGKVKEAMETFGSYNPADKKYEVGVNMLMLWITMGKADARFGGDIKFIGELRRNLTQGGKSLAEILKPLQGVNLGSAMRYDYIGLQNFLFKAHQKGVLPINIEGKDPVITKSAVRDTKLFGLQKLALESMFKKIDAELENLEEKTVNKPGVYDNLMKSIYQKASEFGKWSPFGLKTKYEDKYNYSARRMYEMFGIGWQKNIVQFGVYSVIALLAIIVVTLQQGTKELDQSGK